jgi:hypothetical protein
MRGVRRVHPLHSTSLSCIVQLSTVTAGADVLSKTAAQFYNIHIRTSVNCV